MSLHSMQSIPVGGEALPECPADDLGPRRDPEREFGNSIIQGREKTPDAVYRLTERTEYVGKLSSEEERVLEKQWEESNEARCFMLIDPRRHGHLLRLWKLSVQKFNRSPLQFASPSFDIVYEGTGDNDGVWCENFCLALGKIMVHPVLMGKPNLVSFFISFAVALRTRRRRRCIVQMEESCLILIDLARRMSKDTWPEPVEQLLLSAEYKYKDRSFNSVVSALHSLATNTPWGTNRSDRREIAVGFEDLHRILAALEMELRVVTPTQYYNYEARLLQFDIRDPWRSSGERPFHDDRLRELHIHSWKFELRLGFHIRQTLLEEEQHEAEQAQDGAGSFAMVDEEFETAEMEVDNASDEHFAEAARVEAATLKAAREPPARDEAAEERAAKAAKEQADKEQAAKKRADEEKAAKVAKEQLAKEQAAKKRAAEERAAEAVKEQLAKKRAQAVVEKAAKEKAAKEQAPQAKASETADSSDGRTDNGIKTVDAGKSLTGGKDDQGLEEGEIEEGNEDIPDPPNKTQKQHHKLPKNKPRKLKGRGFIRSY
ncbi:hypothetical protein B0I35DRAFT_415663 [Stachybotrys elegans]|uniref:Uncharacterized protein n=1 Tax=Stachybotrys elegans TaxID=80388 RepID=A0A8K0T2P1_9HYPO|nr:hypothetical protein B0I35DRAFT_415663 [Stachybotrys elegans]